MKIQFFQCSNYIEWREGQGKITSWWMLSLINHREPTSRILPQGKHKDPVI